MNTKYFRQCFLVLAVFLTLFGGLMGSVQKVYGEDAYTLAAINVWTAENMKVYYNATEFHETPQILYLTEKDGGLRPLFCIKYGASAHTGDKLGFVDEENYFNLNRNQKRAISYVLGCGVQMNPPSEAGLGYAVDYTNTAYQTQMYNYWSTQLMIWYYIDKYSDNPGSGNTGGITWAGVEATCNAGWGNLAECNRIWSAVERINQIPSFGVDYETPGAVIPSYEMSYNSATGKYEILLENTNTQCSLKNFVMPNDGVLDYQISNADGTANDEGNYLKVTSDVAIPANAQTSVAGSYEPNAGDIWYVRNDTSEQPMLACYGTKNADPVQYAFSVYTASPQLGGIRLHKTDIDNGNRPVEGAVYGIYAMEEITFQSKNYASGQMVLTMTTDPDGIASVSGLPAAAYKVKEIKAPAGYGLDDTEYMADVRAGVIAGNPVVRLEVTEETYVHLEISKQDITTGKELPGAFLVITDAEGNEIDKWVSADKPHKVDGTLFTVGKTYTLTETIAPEGYTVAQSIRFTIKDTTDLQQIEMKDELVKGVIRIYKTGDQVVSATEYSSVYGTFKRLDFTQKPLQGTVFEIYRAKDDELVDTVTTGADGYAVSRELPWGEYYLVETRTKNGLVLDSEPIVVTLSLPENYHEAVYYADAAAENKVSNTEVNVYKQGEILNIADGTYSFGTKPLPGVIFGVYADTDILDYEGNVVVRKDECIGFIKTGEDGKASLKDALVEGAYYYREVQTLDGYILDGTKREFTLVLGNTELNTMDVNKENPDVNRLYKTRLQLVKSDSADHGVVLSGVVFELYNEKDELMGTYTTDENGQIIVDNLPYGSYYFKETKAADGYQIDTSRQSFLAASEGMLMEITNDRILETPQTGDAVPVWPLAWLAVLFGISGVYLSLRKRK